MREKIIFIVLLLFCEAVSAQDTSKTNPPVLKDSVSALGRTDSNKVAALTYVTYLDSGTASWYGPTWEGRMTASGEYFSPDSMTAAHKWLPFGTIVKVTNLSNDSVIYVRITDRLPKSSKRSIDLTPTAAKRLGFYSKGIQKVRMESVGRTEVRKKTKSTGPLQVGQR